MQSRANCARLAYLETGEQVEAKAEGLDDAVGDPVGDLSLGGSEAQQEMSKEGNEKPFRGSLRQQMHSTARG